MTSLDNSDLSQGASSPSAPAPEELKMWVVIRTDIAMPLGKLAAQVGHAFYAMSDEMWFGDVPKAKWHDYKAYRTGSNAKIAVRADTEAMLLRIHKEAQEAGIPSHLVLDAGRTVFAEPTYTVCAFGPARRSELPPFLRRLRLYE